MSCDNLLTKWLAFYDPIHRGFTPRGIANGGTEVTAGPDAAAAPGMRRSRARNSEGNIAARSAWWSSMVSLGILPHAAAIGRLPPRELPVESGLGR